MNIFHMLLTSFCSIIHHQHHYIQRHRNSPTISFYALYSIPLSFRDVYNSYISLGISHLLYGLTISGRASHHLLSSYSPPYLWICNAAVRSWFWGTGWERAPRLCRTGLGVERGWRSSKRIANNIFTSTMDLEDLPKKFHPWPTDSCSQYLCRITFSSDASHVYVNHGPRSLRRIRCAVPQHYIHLLATW